MLNYILIEITREGHYCNLPFPRSASRFRLHYSECLGDNRSEVAPIGDSAVASDQCVYQITVAYKMYRVIDTFETVSKVISLFSSKIPFDQEILPSLIPLHIFCFLGIKRLPG